MHQTFLAFDLGAESGRGILATFDGEAIELGEGVRFSTAGNIGCPDPDGVHRWNLPSIASEMTSILKAAEEQTKGSLSGVLSGAVFIRCFSLSGIWGDG